METVLTIGLDTPWSMAAAAQAATGHAILKLKLGGSEDAARVAAVRAVVPHKRLIADVNEAWDAAGLIANPPAMAAAGTDMLAQPLRAAADGRLAGMDGAPPIGGAVSCHVSAIVSGLDQGRRTGRKGLSRGVVV